MHACVICRQKTKRKRGPRSIAARHRRYVKHFGKFAILSPDNSSFANIVVPVSLSDHSIVYENERLSTDAFALTAQGNLDVCKADEDDEPVLDTDSEAGFPTYVPPTLTNRDCFHASPNDGDSHPDTDSDINFPTYASSPSIISSSLTIFHLNISGLRSHLNELYAFIALFSSPPILICLNESNLDSRMKDSEIAIPGYVVVARRDRKGYVPPVFPSPFSYNHGGIIAYCLARYEENVSCVLESNVAERVWLNVHTDIGNILVSVCYRPPSPGNTSFIDSLYTEYNQLMQGYFGAVFVGDFNCHLRSWLRYSNDNTSEGKACEVSAFNMVYLS